MLKLVIDKFEKVINKDLSLKIPSIVFDSGKINVVQGANGTGKTTFLLVLLRTDLKYKGLIKYIKDDCEYNPKNKDIIYVPPKNALVKYLSIKSNLNIFNRIDINSFINEFKSFHEHAISIENVDSSLKNLELLLQKIYLVVQKSENRNSSMKQVNIYTLNYDDLVERKLMKLGYFYNSISASNTNAKAALINVIGLDYVTNDDTMRRPFNSPPVIVNYFYHSQIKKRK